MTPRTCGTQVTPSSCRPMSPQGSVSPPLSVIRRRATASVGRQRSDPPAGRPKPQRFYKSERLVPETTADAVLEGLGPSRIMSIKANISETAKRQRARRFWPIRSVKLTTWTRNLKSKKRPRCLCVAARIQKHDSIMVNAVPNHLDGGRRV